MKKINHKYLTPILLISLFSLMLISPEQVFQGAKYGLILWFQTILPTLLPFSIISNILIETHSLYYISNVFTPILKPLFQISSAGVFVVIIGFLCGYPLGAKVIGKLYQNNSISQEEAEYLLSFCNNVSPIFIINYLVIFSFQNTKILIPTLLILMLSPILCSFLFRYKNGNIKHASEHTRIFFNPSSTKSFHLSLLNECMMDSFEMMLYLGGYIIVFSILFTLLKRCSFLPIMKYVLPFLEVTNGISYIQTLPISFRLRFIFTLAITSFGGCCSIMQTQLVVASTNLSIKKYIIKKLITMLVTSLIAYLYLLFI